LTTDVGTPEGVEAAAARAASERRRAWIATACLATAAVGVFAPILYYMIIHWKVVPDYSHGFLVAPLAAYFAWERRARLRRTPVEPSWWGWSATWLGSTARRSGSAPP